MGLNLDQTGMCHRRLEFTTLFWSGKSQKAFSGTKNVNHISCSGATTPPLWKNYVLYSVVLETKTIFMLTFLSNDSTIPLKFYLVCAKEF